MSAEHHHNYSTPAAAVPRTSNVFENAFAVAVFAVILGSVVFAGGGAGWLGTFSKYFLAFMLEAVPFILIGAVFSGLVEVFLPPEFLPRITKRLGPLGIPLTAVLAAAFPICECGVVVVARGLMRKGLPLAHAITYLLAAPIFNPVVLASTYVAFSTREGAWSFVIARGAGGLIIAIAAGFILGLIKPGKAFERGFAEELKNSATADHGHGVSKAADVLGHTKVDFLAMAPFLMFGVACASAMKTFIPSQAMLDIGNGPVSGPFVMMASAVLLSLCSEADAFIGFSFSWQFAFPAVMSFLVLGPMLDIKLLLMYRTVFKKRFIVLFASVVVALVALYTAVLGALF